MYLMVKMGLRCLFDAGLEFLGMTLSSDICMTDVREKDPGRS